MDTCSPHISHSIELQNRVWVLLWILSTFCFLFIFFIQTPTNQPTDLSIDFPFTCITVCLFVYYVHAFLCVAFVSWWYILLNIFFGCGSFPFNSHSVCVHAMQTIYCVYHEKERERDSVLNSVLSRFYFRRFNYDLLKARWILKENMHQIALLVVHDGSNEEWRVCICRNSNGDPHANSKHNDSNSSTAIAAPPNQIHLKNECEPKKNK